MAMKKFVLLELRNTQGVPRWNILFEMFPRILGWVGNNILEHRQLSWGGERHVGDCLMEEKESCLTLWKLLIEMSVPQSNWLCDLGKALKLFEPLFFTVIC